MSAEFRARRSVLYMPGANDRALAKAAVIPCDGLILDLEDAVAPEDKERARTAACAAVIEGNYAPREVTIRVNGMGTEWHEDDMGAACDAAPDAIVVPKVDSPDQVRELVATMERHDASSQTTLWAMIETPQAMLNAAAIAGAHERLSVLVVGTNDLAKELFVAHLPGRAPLLTALGMALLGARASGKAILDGVFNDVADAEGFAAEAQQGRDLGFDGKTLIHPSQVDPANEIFAPSAEAVADAQGILAAWEGRTAGVVTYRGKMVESLHVESARRTLAIHEAIVG